MKVAVILCGSGYLDGSEIRESVATLWALDKNEIEVQCYAPDANQKDVVNTLKQTEMQEERNMLIESARIARSNIKPLSHLDPKSMDGLAIPGGFGVAKNLCSFAFDGENASIDPEISELILSTHEQKKPILAVCIAPALVALALKDKNSVQLTLGAQSDASQIIEKWGHQHKICQAKEFCVDPQNKIVSTPAYMFDDAKISEVFCGIESAVESFKNLAS